MRLASRHLIDRFYNHLQYLNVLDVAVSASLAGAVLQPSFDSSRFEAETTRTEIPSRRRVESANALACQGHCSQPGVRIEPPTSSMMKVTSRRRSSRSNRSFRAQRRYTTVKSASLLRILDRTWLEAVVVDERVLLDPLFSRHPLGGKGSFP